MRITDTSSDWGTQGDVFVASPLGKHDAVANRKKMMGRCEAMVTLSYSVRN
jgi:hypothetical protein